MKYVEAMDISICLLILIISKHNTKTINVEVVVFDISPYVDSKTTEQLVVTLINRVVVSSCKL